MNKFSLTYPKSWLGAKKLDILVNGERCGEINKGTKTEIEVPDNGQFDLKVIDKYKYSKSIRITGDLSNGVLIGVSKNVVIKLTLSLIAILIQLYLLFVLKFREPSLNVIPMTVILVSQLGKDKHYTIQNS
jgi:hypothetical protein